MFSITVKSTTGGTQMYVVARTWDGMPVQTDFVEPREGQTEEEAVEAWIVANGYPAGEYTVTYE